MKKLVYCLLALLGASPLLLTAQEGEIEVVNVTANPLSDVDGHIIQPVNVLTKEELKRRSVQNIGETVANQLGVSSADFGAGVGRPVIRGLGGARVKVLQDGIGSMDASSTSADHAVTGEPVFARQVEILRGPATLLYGSGTSAGLVNIVNDRILDRVPEGVEGDVLAQYETVSDGFLGAAQLNAGVGNFAFHFDGMLRDRDDYDIPGFSETEPDAGEEADVQENSFLESEVVTGGVSWVGDRGFIGFSVNSLNSEYGIPGEHHHEEEGEEEEEEEEEGGVFIDLEQTRYDLKGRLDQPVQGLRWVRTRWGYNDYEHAEVEPSGEIGTQFDIEELEGRVEAAHDTLAGWDGVIGMQYNDREFSAVGEEAFVPPAEQDSIAVFLVETRDLGDLHLDLGFRYEDTDSNSSTGASVDHQTFSASAGIDWHYAEGYKAGVSFSHSQRAPTIEELFSNGPHLATNAFEIGNVGLDQEDANNIELHWRKTSGRFTVTANLFYNQINDFIFLQEQDLNNDGVADRVEEDFSGDPAEILDPDEDEEPLLLFHTQDDADFIGFELEGMVNIFSDKRGNMDLRLWTDYVEAERDGGANLPRITPWRIGAGLNYARGPFNLSVEYTHTGDQNDTAPLETATQGFDMLNIYASYTYDFDGTEFTVFARGTNLLDEEVRRHTSFVKDLAPLPGASGIIGIRSSF